MILSDPQRQQEGHTPAKAYLSIKSALAQPTSPLFNGSFARFAQRARLTQVKQDGGDCSVAEMRAVGFTERDFKDADFSALELKEGGFSLRQLKDVD
ncbi:MAG: hypothetical protein CMO32_32815, partial [Variovorax sp.]|nr:hypothetical protein [Variovorax sp.]